MESLTIRSTSAKKGNITRKHTGDICAIHIYKCCAQLKKSQPHKQHIWFLPTHEPTLKKPKELFFANARKENDRSNNHNRIDNWILCL